MRKPTSEPQRVSLVFIPVPDSMIHNTRTSEHPSIIPLCNIYLSNQSFCQVLRIRRSSNPIFVFSTPEKVWCWSSITLGQKTFGSCNHSNWVISSTSARMSMFSVSWDSWVINTCWNLLLCLAITNPHANRSLFSRHFLRKRLDFTYAHDCWFNGNRDVSPFGNKGKIWFYFHRWPKILHNYSLSATRVYRIVYLFIFY